MEGVFSEGVSSTIETDLRLLEGSCLAFNVFGNLEEGIEATETWLLNYGGKDFGEGAIHTEPITGCLSGAGREHDESRLGDLVNHTESAGARWNCLIDGITLQGAWSGLKGIIATAIEDDHFRLDSRFGHDLKNGVKTHVVGFRIISGGKPGIDRAEVIGAADLHAVTYVKNNC